MAFRVAEIPDVFPEPVAAAPSGPLLHSRSKDYFLQLPDVTCFTFRLSPEEMKFYKLYDGTPMTWKHEILQDNFARTAVASTRMHREFRPDRIHFDRLQERYQKPLKLKGHNTDVRAGYFWDQRQQFLVKAYFTFGQRTVPSGQVHVYRTTAAPMLFYRLDPNKEHVRKFRVADKWFHKDDQWVYDQFVLQPHSTYAVPEKTTYAVLTVQKTLFSLHVVEGWKEEDDGRFSKPDAERRLVKRVQDDDDDSRRRRRKSEEDSSSSSSKKQRRTDEFFKEIEKWSAPTYPPGTDFETMLTIEQLKSQIQTLTERLAKYENA